MSESIYGKREKRKPWLLFGSTVAALGLVAGGGTYASHENTEMNDNLRSTSPAIAIGELAMADACKNVHIPVMRLYAVQKPLATIINRAQYQASIERKSKRVDVSSATAFSFKGGWAMLKLTGNYQVHLGAFDTEVPLDAQLCANTEGKDLWINIIDNNLPDENRAQILVIAQK